MDQDMSESIEETEYLSTYVKWLSNKSISQNQTKLDHLSIFLFNQAN